MLLAWIVPLVTGGFLGAGLIAYIKTNLEFDHENGCLNSKSGLTFSQNYKRFPIYQRLQFLFKSATT